MAAVTIDLSRCPLEDFPVEKCDEYVYLVLISDKSANERSVVVKRRTNSERYLCGLREEHNFSEVTHLLWELGIVTTETEIQQILLSQAVEVVKKRRKKGEKLAGIVFLDKREALEWYDV